MKKCKVLVPFILGDTGELLKEGKEVELTDDQLARVRKVSPNMVEVLGEAKKPRAKKTE
jgi:hypothetical protein